MRLLAPSISFSTNRYRSCANYHEVAVPEYKKNSGAEVGEGQTGWGAGARDFSIANADWEVGGLFHIVKE